MKPGIGRPFGKRDVPPRDAVMAALGVENAKKGLERERKGAKGMEEIELSAQERLEAEKLEGIWDREQMIEWAKDIPVRDAESWIDRVCTFHADGTIEVDSAQFFADNNQSIKEIPPRLRADNLLFQHTGIDRLPDELEAHILNVSHTEVKRIPPTIRVVDLQMTHTKLEEIPPKFSCNWLGASFTPLTSIPEGVKIKEIDLIGTSITTLPEDLGELRKIKVGDSQAELQQVASARGLEVETVSDLLFV